MADTEKLKISAVIPAYNADKYIARSIDSVLSQTRPVDEIVVVDDGSTDNTAAVIKSYGDKIRYIHQPNAGVSAARNTGIEAATGDWIAFLDADDEWVSERIQWQIELLDRNPDLVWVSGNYTRCLCEEKRARTHIAESEALDALGSREFFENFFTAYAQNRWGCTDTMLIKKSVFKETGLFQVGQQQMEDIDLWWRIGQKYPKIGYIAKPISTYHLNIVGSLIQSQTDYSYCRQMIRRHLEVSKNSPLHDDIKACSVRVLKSWMRSMLFKKQKVQLLLMLDEFKGLFSLIYRITMRILTISPGLTAWILHRISWVVRRFKLRKQLTRKPINTKTA
ncbi:MAG: glycosyltransferase family 2 protein [Planctomycetota bacterium]|jgi:glycosyltransferase involved in cell wall biosynthesis